MHCRKHKYQRVPFVLLCSCLRCFDEMMIEMDTNTSVKLQIDAFSLELQTPPVTQQPQSVNAK